MRSKYANNNLVKINQVLRSEGLTFVLIFMEASHSICVLPYVSTGWSDNVTWHLDIILMRKLGIGETS